MITFTLLALPSLVLIFTALRMPRLALVLSLYLCASALLGSPIGLALGLVLVLLSTLPNVVRRNLGRLVSLAPYLYPLAFLPLSKALSLAVLALAIPSVWFERYRAILLVALSSLFLSTQLGAMYYLECWTVSLVTILFTFLGILLCPIRKREKPSL